VGLNRGLAAIEGGSDLPVIHLLGDAGKHIHEGGGDRSAGTRNNSPEASHDRRSVCPRCEPAAAKASGSLHVQN
jgi:hypothetical protein